MYRQYENPWVLEEELSKLEYELSMAEYDNADIDVIVDIKIEIEELKERINFAWQDEEYDEMNHDYADEMWMWENCYNTDMDWDEDVQIMYEESEIMREYGEI